MRYCTNCGNKIENERFCTQCGADNGPVNTKKTFKTGKFYVDRSGSDKIKSNADRNDFSKVSLSNINAADVAHWMSIAFFVIASVIVLVKTYVYAEEQTSYFMLTVSGSILMVVYYVLGMWSMVPAVKFLVYGKTVENKKVVFAAAVMLAITIIICIFHAVLGFVDVIEGNRIINSLILAFEVYDENVVLIIILEVLSIFAGILSMRAEKGGVAHNVVR